MAGLQQKILQMRYLGGGSDQRRSRNSMTQRTYGKSQARCYSNAWRNDLIVRWHRSYHTEATCSDFCQCTMHFGDKKLTRAFSQGGSSLQLFRYTKNWAIEMLNRLQKKVRLGFVLDTMKRLALLTQQIQCIQWISLLEYYWKWVNHPNPPLMSALEVTATT